MLVAGHCLGDGSTGLDARPSGGINDLKTGTNGSERARTGLRERRPVGLAIPTKVHPDIADHTKLRIAPQQRRVQAQRAIVFDTDARDASRGIPSVGVKRSGLVRRGALSAEEPFRAYLSHPLKSVFPLFCSAVCLFCSAFIGRNEHGGYRRNRVRPGS